MLWILCVKLFVFVCISYNRRLCVCVCVHSHSFCSVVSIITGCNHLFCFYIPDLMQWLSNQHRNYKYQRSTQLMCWMNLECKGAIFAHMIFKVNVIFEIQLIYSQRTVFFSSFFFLSLFLVYFSCCCRLRNWRYSPTLLLNLFRSLSKLFTGIYWNWCELLHGCYPKSC